MAVRVPLLGRCFQVQGGVKNVGPRTSTGIFGRALPARTLDGARCSWPSQQRGKSDGAARGPLRATAELSNVDQYPDEATMIKKRDDYARQYLLDNSLLAPQPSPTQQTLRSSFVRRGIGLHSGAPVVVRVRPAFAGEGRYFVKVPPGTIVEDEDEDDEELEGEELEEMKLEFFKMSLLDDEERAAREAELFPERDLNISKEVAQEVATEGVAGETRIPASLDAVVKEQLQLCTKLAFGDAGVGTVEHLLSALEASGVDNARIEVEEGSEMPVLDGSAEGWVLGVKDCGVVEAQTTSGAMLPRKAWQPKAPIVVSSGDSFVMLHPEARTRLTYIVDFTAKTEAIGRQSFTWCPTEDKPYAHEIASARTFTTLEDAHAARAAGLIKGGSPVNALIVDRSMYQNGPLRYNNEPVRHKMLDLIGDLSLAATDGNAGLPIGHVVAYKASHDLHVKFAKKLLEECSAADQVTYGGEELN